MVIVSINTCLEGSTGRIMLQISDTARKRGNTCYTVVSYQKKKNRKVVPTQYDMIIGNWFDTRVHLFFGRLTGYQGAFSIFSTLKLLHKLNKIEPSIIHLHNLHDSYINIPFLFNYIKQKNIAVVWTLHDAWAFTGHCPYFTISKCDKWKSYCDNCHQFHNYPKSYFDNSKKMFAFKKKHFLGVQNMHIVTPSNWLAKLAKQSFLQNYDISVINNGINLDIFTPKKAGKISEKFHDHFLLLGVSFDWSTRKGFDVFLRLAEDLDPSLFQIVIVGMNKNNCFYKKDNIYFIEKTYSQEELANIYSDADLFINPTREENYPTVNMESIACGTPVVAYNTGGSPEIVRDCGITVGYDNYSELKQTIILLKENSEKYMKLKNNCLIRRTEFDIKLKYNEYIEMYQRILE